MPTKALCQTLDQRKEPSGHDSLCKLPFLPLGDFPILFHSVKSGIEEATTTKSRRNLAEVDVVVKYVNLCLQQQIKEKDIGIIAPYKFQAEKIRSCLKNNPEVTVATVERFQGSERRVIIISTVRTSGDLRFVTDNLRINTTITRAKHLLIIVGNEECLKTDSTWKKIINFCADNRSFINSFRDEIVHTQQNRRQ
uniref:DNA2/NAM7 helicase-like C-terminal domain-containing protein n=1 Tax=Panagrolaimus davidi TaxID=227884 RepID=A0A914QS63_9BILA